jgi:hypothetical protein
VAGPGRRWLAIAVSAALAAAALVAAGLAVSRVPADGTASAPSLAAPATSVSYPAGAGATWYAGLAFDAPCTAPSLPQLRAWRASPYRAIGVSVSGPNRRCPEPFLDPAWVAGASALGWRIIPLDQGLQAPCSTTPENVKMSWRPAAALAQGRAAAAGAVTAAGALGLGPGSAVYTDMESYPPGTTCQHAVLGYLSGWTRGLHARGYLSGVYSGNASGTRHLSAAYSSAVYARPDAVWNAWYNGDPALAGWPGVPDWQWAGQQRIRQYTIGVPETYGGVTLRIDNDNADTPVAATAHARTVISAGRVGARRGPGSGYPVAATYPPGAAVSVICRAAGTGGPWEKLPTGAYLPARTLGGAQAAADSLPVAPCRYPFQVAAGGGTGVFAGPSASRPRTGRLPAGALAWITCQRAGTAVGASRIWDKLGSRRWVPDHWLATSGRTGYTRPIPRC